VFVTSDIFDLERIAARRQLADWREHLICGVAFVGTQCRGIEAAARFYLRAAEVCGLEQHMKWATYVRADGRERYIKPTSLERLAQGKLRGAIDAWGLLFRGSLPAPGADGGALLVGGEASLSRRSLLADVSAPNPAFPDRCIDGSFLFPLDARPRETASNLLRLALDLLGAEYGYYFVRDDLCFPMNYPWGQGSPLDHGALQRDDDDQGRHWRDFVRDGRLWAGEWPQLRDLYEINLLSERHLSVPTKQLGYLGDWIVAQPGRGRLEEIGQGRVLWALTDAEMYQIRPLLNRAGLLRSARPRIYRDLPIEQERPDPGTRIRFLTKH
jgi:hypothetical protein